MTARVGLLSSTVAVVSSSKWASARLYGNFGSVKIAWNDRVEHTTRDFLRRHHCAAFLDAVVIGLSLALRTTGLDLLACGSCG